MNNFICKGGIAFLIILIFSSNLNGQILENSIILSKNVDSLSILYGKRKVNNLKRSIFEDTQTRLSKIAEIVTEDAYADTLIDSYYSGANSNFNSFYGGTLSKYPVYVDPEVVLGNNETFLSLPTGSYVTVGFLDNTIIDAVDQDDIFIEEIGSSNENAEIYISSNLIDFIFIGIANDGGITSFDLADIGFTEPVKAITIVGLDNLGGSPGFDVVSVRAIAGAIGPAPTEGTLKGKIADSKTNQPLENVIITLILQNNQTYQTTTDQNGEYSFNNILFGKYSINIKKTGFIPIDTNIDHTTILSIENFNMVSLTISVEDKKTELPQAFNLLQNYPNPFNPGTMITYILNQKTDVAFTMYNSIGQMIRTYEFNKVSPGKHTLWWDGTDSEGNSPPSGIYLCRMSAGNHSKTIKMLLFK